MKWIQLTNYETLESLIDDSVEKPALIFKHSTRCGVSRMVLRQFEKDFDTDDLTPYLLDLLQYREISNEIEGRFGVVHQSPQVIVVKNGQAVYDASHEGIAAEILNNIV